jgi:hypothetical protein
VRVEQSPRQQVEAEQREHAPDYGAEVEGEEIVAEEVE